MVKKTATAAKPAAKSAPAKAPAKSSAKAPAKGKTEPVTNRSAKYSAGELTGAKPNATQAAEAAAKAGANKGLNDDKIVNIAGARSGPDGTKILETELSKAGGHKDSIKASLAISPDRWTSEVRRLAVLGGSLKAVRAYLAAHKPDAKLAHGVTARTSPNAAKAASDQHKHKAAPTAKIAAKGQTQAAKAAKPAKAERSPNVTVDGKRKSGQAYGGKVTDDMSITVTASASPYKAGSKADNTFALFGKAKTVADFKKMVAKAPDKYDAGYIRYAARDGFIRLG